MRVVVTRPVGQEAELMARLEELGHDVVHCPLIEVEPLSDEPIVLDGYDWVIVTSANGARELLRRAAGALPRVAAIGLATAAVVGRVDLVPRISTQEGLLAEFPPSPGRVLIAGAAGSRRLLADELGADFLPLYRTRELRPASSPEGDLCVLASSSAARALAALSTDMPAVSIGPETSKTARQAGIVVVAEARTHDTDGLVEAVERTAAS